MPTKNPNSQGSHNEGESKILAFLRQYLTILNGSDPVEEVRKHRVSRHPRHRKPKIYVKKMDVNLAKKRVIKPKAEVPEAEPEIGTAMEKSLEQYINRRSAYINRYTTKRKSPLAQSVVPTPEKPSTPASPAITQKQVAGAKADAGSWNKFVKLLPFMSETVVETAKRTEALETKLQKNEEQAKAMAARLKEAEAALQARLKNGKAETLKAPTRAPVELTAEELGRLKQIAKQSVPSGPQEVITKDDLGGLRRIEDKKDHTFGLMEKPKRGFFANLFGGMKDMAADMREAAPAKGPAAPAPKAAAPVRGAAIAGQAPASRGGTLLAKATATPEPVATPVSTAKEEAALGELLSSFEDKKAKAEPAPVQVAKEKPAAPAPTLPPQISLVDRKANDVARKAKLETEERRAEYLMMTAAANKPKAKEAGFLTQLGASIQFLGMGKEKLAIVQNLATMLNAGLPLIDALKTLQMETKNRTTKKILSRINTAVDNGSPLWRAMDDQHFFSPHAIALIRIGEEAGNLAENMVYLSEQQEKDENLREKVKMAMIYPIIVMTLMFIVVMGLGMFVLPQLTQVLFNLNVKLPLVTRLVIAFSDGFSKHGAIVVPACIGGALLFGILAKFTRLKVLVQWIVFKIPGIGSLQRQATLGRFGVILGGLLQAGVPLVESLRSLVEVTTIVAYKRFYRRLLEHVTVGDSFAKCFAVIRGSNSLIPVSMQQLIITGERTGSLAKIMLKVAAIYEKEANNTAQKLPVILEPMLLLFIGALVGTIAFAIIIPIYSVVGNVNH